MELENTLPSQPVPITDVDRLAALHQYNILDTPPEAAFDELTQLAAQLCQTPVALITFVDSDRQWFKSSFGASRGESPLDVGFCPFVVDKGTTLIIPDTQASPQFATNPAVTDSGVQFYAGVPLITPDGHVIGTLCVLDFVKRQIQQEQIAGLEILSRQVMTQLGLRLSVRQVAQINAALTTVSCGVATSVGETFFYSLVQHFTQALGVKYTYIALLVNRDLEALQTIAVCANGNIADDFEYLLRDTPCQEVIRQRKLCCYSRNVQAQFPQAPLLAPLQIESYAAIPFFDSTGKPLGLLGVMDTKPLDAIQLAESLLTIFAVRIGTELERQQAAKEQAQLFAREQEARQMAEAANRIKDEFLAVLSHELRSPLNPILGWARMLKSGRCNAATTTAALDTIERNAQLQAQLIEDLLDISRILHGKLTLNITSVSLTSVVWSALDTVRLAVDAKSLDLQVEMPLDEGVQVMGDAARLQQVVWNLLSNAVKFTPNAGRINVAVSIVRERENFHAQISIEDTGKGIHPEFLPYVFESFRQEDSKTTRKFGGLGLGLAIVRQIVELHGGTVTANSRGEGQGATFIVQIPLSKRLVEPSALKQSPPSTVDLSGIQILLVDDETDSRELIAFVLEQAYANVTAVSSGVEALEAIAHSIPDIIISDIGMPEMDGYMLIGQIRRLAAKNGGNIRAIALTAYAGEYDQQQARAAGFQLHLSKPVDVDELVRAIAKLILCPVKHF